MDTSINTIKVYNGANFVRIANANIGTTTPSNPEAGQMFFNTTSQKFNVYNGTQFVEIGPSDEAIPFAIVFGA
jgi:ribosomal protein S19